MAMLRKTVSLAVAAAIAVGVAACGEDRSGDVKFEGDTGTNTTSTTGTETTGTETTGTETTP
jgi:uncharacterized lipoprotein YehR (DUF1307 family)